MDIDVSTIDEDTEPPFAVSLGDLIADTVTDGDKKVWIDFGTNGESGGRVYIAGTNAGLLSSHGSHTISSVSGNLGVLNEGIGAQGDTIGQASGGPLTISTAYDVTGDNVGIFDATFRELFSSVAPIVNGRGSFVLKAKSSAVTPAASDYTESLIIVAAANF